MGKDTFPNRKDKNKIKQCCALVQPTQFQFDRMAFTPDALAVDLM